LGFRAKEEKKAEKGINGKNKQEYEGEGRGA